MNIILIIALSAVGINALPKTNYGSNIDLRNERLVTNSIESAIQDFSQVIRDAGLDPFHIESASEAVALPVPALFSAEGSVVEFLCTGLSNIVVVDLRFNILTSRLTFNINLPLIQLSLKKAQIQIDTFGEQFSAHASGSLAIRSVSVHGNVRVNVRPISGISIRSVDVFFNLGGIESALNVVVQKWDLSNLINTFFGSTIPYKVYEFSAEINELLEIIIKRVVEANL